jgi:hypothetical protein
MHIYIWKGGLFDWHPQWTAATATERCRNISYYVSVYTCVNIYINKWICAYIWKGGLFDGHPQWTIATTYMYVRMYLCVYIHTFIYVYTYIWILLAMLHTHILIYIYIYLCIFICRWVIWWASLVDSYNSYRKKQPPSAEWR